MRFSSEFGWTSGPALNIVTKAGTNGFHGEGLFLSRPGHWQAKTFSTKGFCPPPVSSCVTPATLTAIEPVDIPDALSQVSGSLGGPIVKDKTFFFATADYTRRIEPHSSRRRCLPSCCPRMDISTSRVTTASSCSTEGWTTSSRLIRT